MTAHTAVEAGTGMEADTEPMLVDDNSSTAPHMTNSNYRIIMPTSSIGNRKHPATSLPAWISAGAQSKTYFPARSPIAANECTAADEDMVQEGEPELRTEYDVLPYEIFAWSNHSANFLPHNILTDRPHDQASRWSTNANNHRQFITLRLERPALVRSIKFGKFYKTHVCNLKEFKVFGGMSPDNMIELLYSGLRNDSEAETISLKQRLNGHYIPCQYIKIQPLLAYDQKFNFSIWHVELRGTMDAAVVGQLSRAFAWYQERETVRACLKFFRDRGYTDAFDALARQTRAQLEAPVLGQLRQALVERRDYARAEQLLREAEERRMFAACAGRIPYAARWRAVAGAGAVPAARGGHQMCVDEERRVAYLYGGWDGVRNLDDLWALSLDSGTWRCLSTGTREQGGPGARSCHAMCFDSVRRSVYVMGRYVDHEYRGAAALDNDLFCYDTVGDEWLVVSENTEALGGPRLVFNAQMAYDARRQRVYVYGGKVVQPDSGDSTIVYSGLYSFDVRRHRWARLKPDFHMLEQEQHVRGRYFHALLVDSEQQRLYIVSSKRDVSVPSDLIVYDIATDTFFEKMADLGARTGRPPMTQARYLHEQQARQQAPAGGGERTARAHGDGVAADNPLHVHLLQDGRTIRATLDTGRQEIYVLASVQNDVHAAAAGPLLQSLMAARGEQAGYAGTLYAQAQGAGFHPCSSLMDSGVRYAPERAGSGGTGGGTGGGGGQAEHILMVVFCYHIPTETWTQVHSSARAAAQMGEAPAPRFAQDWVFDRAARRHYMFGGNPNRPNDKSARFNDTWQLEFTRPDSGDILRRALYLVRQRRFLDMCAGAEAAASSVACEHSAIP
ncbi:hypothetical protein IWW55_004181, partial [Coemansia sp. RSA 2706]